MKKLLVVFVVVALALVGANAAMATIAGSKHDMTSASYAGADRSACAYCHTPHRPNTAIDAPLWNRTMPPAAGAYTTYGTTYANTAVGAPGTHSLTCLSCHDGTIAMNETYNFTGTVITDGGAENILDATGKIDPAATGYIGTDLRDDHPVGVVYNSANPNPAAGLNAAVDAFVANYTTITGKPWRIYSGGDGVGTVECASCHDPHGDDYTAATANSPFLRGLRNDICTDCHSAK